jgi:hypothetical protein
MIRPAAIDLAGVLSRRRELAGFAVLELADARATLRALTGARVIAARRPVGQ